MPIRAIRPTLYVKRTLEDERVRALLFEKDSSIRVEVVDDPEQEASLAEINTENVYPILIDRNLAIYGRPLDEFIHERWPCPQLLPDEPKQRAYARMLEQWICSWYSKPPAERLASLREVEHSFRRDHRYFFGHQLSIVDVALRPLLRVDDYDPATPHFADYIDRLVAA